MSYTFDKVYEELKELRVFSYSPYSNFRVSCIIYLKNGKKIKGVNVENAAYNPSICAERTAISQLVTQGYNKNDVDFLALYTDSKDFGSPCGTCRQTLMELLEPEQKMWVYNADNFLGEFTLNSFLPYFFSKNSL